MVEVNENETENNVEELWEDYVPEPPDGGWGWVVMIASFCNNFIVDGVGYSFGILLPHYKTHFEVSTGLISVAGSAQFGLMLVFGPLFAALVNRYGLRKVSFFGSVLSSAGMVLSTFSPNVYVFIIFFGFIEGFGFGMMYLPAMVAVSIYFSKKRAIATGIAVCGAGFGTFTITILLDILLSNYTWQQTHFFLAGIMLQGCISSMLLRPLIARRKKSKTQVKYSKEKTITTFSKSADHLTATKKDFTSISYFKSHSGLTEDKDFSRPIYRRDIFYPGSTFTVNGEVRPVSTNHRSSNKSLTTHRSSNKSSTNHKSSNKSSANRKNSHHVVSLISIPDSLAESRYPSCFRKLPKSMADVLMEMLGVDTLKHPGMVIIYVANFIGFLGFFVPFYFVSSRAQHLGIEQHKAGFLLSIQGICNTCGRFLFGFLVSIPRSSALLVHNVCISAAALSVLLTPLGLNYTSMVINVVATGLLLSVMVSLAPLIICDLIGLEKINNAFGILCLVRGLAAIIGPPIEGRLFDITGSYDATFYCGGSFLIIFTVLHYILHCRKISQYSITQTSNQNPST